MPKRVECRWEGGTYGKDCSRCKEFLSSDKFNSDSKTRTGLSSWCKDCRKKYGRKYQKEIDAKTRREYRYKSSYGLTKEGYGKLLEDQDYSCKICGDQGGDLCVDHDHVTGKIRGLLCRECNSGLGLFQDSTELIRKAIKYLQEH